ncbi:Alpha/Beta hydrolase fold [Naviculisporaceae sp. PSN 640]
MYSARLHILTISRPPPTCLLNYQTNCHSRNGREPKTSNMSTDKIQPCCLKGFRWSGTPQGEEITVDLPIANSSTNTSTTRTIPCYKASPPNASPKRAILFIHDLFGWTFPNNRLLADHYAAETNSTVYLPDFFEGLVIDSTLIAQERFDKIDLAGFHQKNSRDIREPEVFAWARYLRQSLRYEKLGAVGFCFGGWACFRLAAQEHEDNGGEKLVDCIAPGHPTWLTEADVDGASPNIGVQILSTEINMPFNKELKSYTWNKLQEKGVKFEWVHFPGIRHGGLVRGDENIQGEREAMVRAKDKVVAFMGEWLGTD